MGYHFSKNLNISFEKAIEKVTENLKNNGFGIISEINLSDTLKEKLGVDVRRYKILGACNPAFALKAITAEENIGTMLPCNVIVQEINGKIRVSAINPIASMQAVKNDELSVIAIEVGDKLKSVIEHL